VSFEGEPSLSSVTDVAPLKAQNLLSSAKNLFEEDRSHGGEAGLTGSGTRSLKPRSSRSSKRCRFRERQTRVDLRTGEARFARHGAEARDGEYADFASPHVLPIIVLVQELEAAGHLDLAARAQNPREVMR
jgi:hypothetical protein